MRRLSLIGVGAVVAALILQGCTTPELSDRYVVPLRDPGIDKDHDSFPLEPGDVVYIVTFLKGSPVPDSNALTNFYPPFSEHIRLPIRHAQGELTADEANLIMGVLATDSIAPPIDVATQTELNTHRIELWNALVDSQALVLRTEGGTKPPQLQVDMTKFCPAFQKAAGKDSILISTYLVETCADIKNAPTREFRQIGALPQPLDAIGQKATNLQGSVFYQSEAAVAIAVARVERHGTEMSQTQLEEGRWSLADWDASLVCRGEIVDVALRSEPLRLLRIMPAGTNARYKIVGAGPGRRDLTVDDHDAPFETLTYESLALLSASDVATVLWGEKRQSSPPNTLAQLSPSQRRACTP